MEILIKNLDWMAFNVMLALLGLIFAWLFYYAKNRFFSVVFFILWILFVPNTIYLITDLQHIYTHWYKVPSFLKIILIAQYVTVATLGVLTFIASMYPINKVFKQLNINHNPLLKALMVIIFNMLIAFALILGKYERTHSWYIFTNFPRVLDDVLSVMTNPILFSMVILFSIVINLTYFAFRNVIPISVNKKTRNKLK